VAAVVDGAATLEVRVTVTVATDEPPHAATPSETTTTRTLVNRRAPNTACSLSAPSGATRSRGARGAVAQRPA
jgi:hypothetical protein